MKPNSSWKSRVLRIIALLAILTLTNCVSAEGDMTLPCSVRSYLASTLGELDIPSRRQLCIALVFSGS